MTSFAMIMGQLLATAGFLATALVFAAFVLGTISRLAR